MLPPSKPVYNGGVESANRIFREEFYQSSQLQADSIGGIRLELRKMLIKYNQYRPHHALKGLMPFEYIQISHSEELTSSHLT